MRIIHVLVINTVPFVMSGISSVIANYYRKTDKDKIQIDIVVNNKIDFTYEKLFKENGSNIYILKRNNNPVAYMAKLYKIIKYKKYDVVHVHGNSATMAVELVIAKVSGIKNRIAHCHNTQCDHIKLHRLLYPIFKESYTYALACSEKAGVWIFGENGFEVLKNAVDLNQYSYSDNVRKLYRQELSIPDNVFLIGHVGYFNEQKNQEFLIDLLNDLSENQNVFMMFIGVGDKQQFVKDKAENFSLCDRVLFMGNRGDVNMLLQAMDIFLFPSKWEGLGIALVEAQLSGLRCIASTNVPTEANISGEVCFVPLSDKAKWQEKIIESMNNKNIARKNRMINAHEKIRNAGYDINNEVKRLEYIYKL